MKIQWIVNVLIAMVGLIAITSWADDGLTTSHYGSGEYHCYYLNVRTNQFHEGVASKKEKAMQQAEKACRSSIKKDDSTACEFAACRFK
ncbi:MAG: hypothetical protein COY58_09680 [Gammaproteobacteria bacterium CG_4_10_14_0_8_um_filter_38_16]|nr:MAG: hypothetical protein COY58_09680 [Gammaproteobacteria bacterium CG_4_10_14_0_8_um_filter_38_16]PJA03047.1 MAG: hypothetical protein COX72_06985 [Gammaproteobacteria bacterium CG_4_10_14_0_2_um_filter_38_22]PJB10223.1 MAG: hypothetical protein CO120_05930 [Gammaproteobacteria bacterium CG_4_9_14_3_um_filter_38_9]